MTQPRTKGLQFRSFLFALKRLRGEEACAATIDLLPSELGDALRYKTLVTGGWYPLEWYAQLHVASQRATREGFDLARAIAREAVQEDFRGVYRLITLALSPQSIFKLAPKIVGLYYDTGKCVIDEAERGFCRGHFDGFVGFDRNLWEDTIGGITGVMELAGAKNMVPRVLGGGKDGDADMSVEVRWT
jgi:hypothetical protein